MTKQQETSHRIRRRLERRVVPQFAYKQGLVTETRYHRVYRDDKHGFQLEVITKRNAAGFPTGKGKTYFFIDGIKTEFRTEAAMLKHYQKMTAAKQSERLLRHNAALSGWPGKDETETEK